VTRIVKAVVTDEDGKEHTFVGRGGMFGGSQNRKGEPPETLVQISITVPQEFSE